MGFSLLQPSMYVFLLLKVCRRLEAQDTSGILPISKCRKKIDFASNSMSRFASFAGRFNPFPTLHNRAVNEQNKIRRPHVGPGVMARKGSPFIEKIWHKPLDSAFVQAPCGESWFTASKTSSKFRYYCCPQACVSRPLKDGKYDASC